MMYSINMKRFIAYVLACIFWILWFQFIWWNVFAQNNVSTCSWIKLNTNFPIIWNCIEYKSDKTNPTNVFPYMVQSLTKIIISLILVTCFILIIYAGILWASDNPTDAIKWLKTVAITILLLWFSWVILRLINPTFFS